MDIDLDIHIRNATPEELQRLLIGMQMTDAALGKPPATKKTEPLGSTKPVMVNTLVMKKTGNRYSNKWGIPIDSVKEPAKYEYARKICKRFGKPYAEAIKLKEAAAEPAKIRKEQACTKLKRAVPVVIKKKKTKWQIPFSPVTAVREYQNAWHLCKKYNKPYPEALALSKTGGKQGGRQIPCLYCEKELNSHGMHMHIKGAHPGKYDEFMKTPDRLHHGIHSGGQTGSADGGHKPASDIKTEPAPSLSESDKIITGIRVMQSKPVDGKLFFGIGTVTARTGDLVTIRNGQGKKYTLDVQNLEIATGPVKTPKRERLPFHQEKDAPVHNVATTAAHYDPDCPECQEDPEHGRFRDEENPEAMSSPPEDDVKIESAEGLSDVMPETRPPTGPAEKREAAAAMAGLKIGDQVRQIGGPRILFGVGTVKRIPPDKPDEVLIGFDNGTEWMLKKNLAPVEAKV
jgi:hypothetical protein